jgi:hypothetical protein
MMRKPNRISKWTVSVALVMALIAFVLGSAPFTPAIFLTVIALPLAVACSFFGVWRLSTVSIYWALAAFPASPIFGVDVSPVSLGVAGLTLSAFLYFTYALAKSTSISGS